MSGLIVVDGITNKSLPLTGINNTVYTTPGPQTQDAVGKFRVSQPQALIDTDFEYGTQPTKWESISLQNNRQSVYFIPQQPLTITAVTGAGTTTVTLTGTFVLPAASAIFVQNAVDPNANGWWFTETGGTNSATFITTNVVASGNQFNPTATYVYRGFFYSSCGIQVALSAFVTSTNTVSVTTVNPHGLSRNSLIYVVGTTGGTNVNGAFVVATVPTANTFTYASTGATGTVTNAAGVTNLFARPAGYVEARPFDGGVAFSAGAAVPNQQLIRQTRRYFRYQSGKGIQFSTGSSLEPSLFVTNISCVGSTVTVTTRYAHSLAINTIVQVQGASPGAFNGQYSIATVPTLNSFTYTVPTAIGTVTGSGQNIRVNPLNWFGAQNRLGMFDQQNGLFFEYDGQNLFAVWRSSTSQINGSVAVTQGSSAVTGTGTLFGSQLVPGDFIVIRGQSYRVLTIASDTSMFISPEYRGQTISNAVVSRTIDVKTPRSLWLDPLDGTGPSGYVLDLTKMQMWYIDYSWYGAGFIRWGLRTSDGQITYVYQQTNNNVQFEAYMRTGNMAAHYESSGLNPITTLSSTLTNTGPGSTVINVADTSLFPPTGSVRLITATQTGAIEIINYTGKTATSFTGLTRGVAGGSAATTFTFSATAPITVEHTDNDTACALSHWGSSVIMDGQFNDDKSLIFNYGTTTAVSTNSTTPVLLMAIRIAPSVDNGITGILGSKEIINRMQLQLESLGIVATGNTYLINLILNGFASGATSGGFISPVQLTNGITSSLAQIALNTTNTVTVTGGESVAAAFCQVASVSTLDLSQVRDLGNSILGGGTNNTVPTSQTGFYPDGPDILYVVAQAVSATAGTVLARLSWKEAQA
jgi:hypothetical protein